MANIKFRKPVRISLFGGGTIPPSFQGWKIMKLPMPRTALPAGTKMCPEETGFTIWHLIALGLFPQDFLEDFLETTTQLPKENLTNELRFHMRTLDDEYASLVNEHPSYPLTWPELKLVSAYRSTGELCQLFGKTLLGWYNLSPDAIKKLPDYIRNFPTVA